LLYRHPHRPGLLSSPTRRSSDLLLSSKPPSPLVFLLISTHFTATLGIPLTSPALQINRFQSSPGVEPRAFTPDLPIRLRSLYTRSEEPTSELQSRFDLVCRLLLE